MSKLIEDFEKVFKAELTTPKSKRFNIENNITLGGVEGSMFDLKAPSVVTENSIEVLNRIVLTPEMVEDLINSNWKGRNLFNQIREEMEMLNCPHYSFERPDGDVFLTLREGDNNLELRACGLRQKD